MYKNKKVAVVVPAYNEETQIERVVETMPDCVDKIVIVDDCSSDKTIEILNSIKDKYPKLLVIEHEVNQGVGGAIVTGYKYARDEEYDIAVVMAGDGQMEPSDFNDIIDPVATGEVDYSKANRLFNGHAFNHKKIPKVRYFGNSVLSLMTKIASGYWHVADSQTGYTAINLKMLKLINWDYSYKRYGCPNDYLVRLNIYNAKVRDVPIEPTYGVGEQSKMKIHKVIPRMLWLLFRLFVKRMFQKYVIRDFHPLVLFYGAAVGTFMMLIPLTLRLVWGLCKTHEIFPINALACVMLFLSFIQFSLFAMFFDMETNRHLR